MVTRYDCTNADPVVLRGGAQHCIGRSSRRRGLAGASGRGIAPCPSSRHGFMGHGRRSQTGPTTFPRLRCLRILRLANRCAHLSFSDPRRTGLPDIAMLHRDLRPGDARRHSGIRHSRVCVARTVRLQLRAIGPAFPHSRSITGPAWLNLGHCSRHDDDCTSQCRE